MFRNPQGTQFKAQIHVLIHRVIVLNEAFASLLKLFALQHHARGGDGEDTSRVQAREPA